MAVRALVVSCATTAAMAAKARPTPAQARPKATEPSSGQAGGGERGGGEHGEDEVGDERDRQRGGERRPAPDGGAADQLGAARLLVGARVADDQDDDEHGDEHGAQTPRLDHREAPSEDGS